MKKILTCFSSLIIFSITTQAQLCQVTASASVNVVCLGNPVTISATAMATLPANQFFDFNQNQLPQGWSTTGGTNYGNNICGSSPDGTPYFWASTVTSGVPQIVTADFDVCSGGYLEFEMRYAVQAGPSPCEGPDERDEGISLEYSLNGGGTWVEFRYFQPDGQIINANPGGNNVVANGATPFTVWAVYNIPIPAAAISASTRFRWVQRFSSGGCCDNWGLDNIGVYAGPCLTTDLVWSNGMSGVGSFTFTPTADTCFIANLYDDNNNFLCNDTVCITVAPHYASSFNQTICSGQTYMFGPTSSTLLPYTSSGSYPATFTAVTGCDSVVTLNLTVQPPIISNTTASVCFGDSYTLGANTYNATGIYTDTLSTVSGCDSTVTLNLTVKPQLLSTINAAICNGDSYTLGPQTFNTAGQHQVVFTASDGCDSTVTLNLTVNPTYTGTFDTSLCAGVSFTFGGHVFTGAGSYPVMFNTVAGCDSLITLGITIMPAPVPDAGNDITLCSGQTGVLGGPPAANTTYVWTGGGGLSDNTVSGPIVSVTSLVPQVITYVVTGHYQGCVASDSVDVTIVPYPVVNLQPVAPQCYQGNLYDFDPGNGFLPSATFNWNFTNAVPSGGVVQNPTGIHFNSSGTHQAVVQVSNGACATSDTMDVLVYAEPQAALQPQPANGCVPLTVQFQNNSTPAGAVTSFWSFGNGQNSASTAPSTVYNQPGNYDVLLVVTSAEGCIDSVYHPQLITAYPLPEAGFTPNPFTVYQDDASITVNDNSVGASTWAYDVSSGGFYATPTFGHQFYDTGYHYIHQVVTTAYGCTDEHTEMIHVKPASTIFVPNAFTPNNDGVNTFFTAIGNTVRDFHLLVFDRWGGKVFESRDINEGWDGTIRGKPIKQDVYVYRISYVNHRGDTKELLGHVVLIR